MEFQPDDIKHMAALARIELSEHDVEKFREQLSSVLAYVDHVASVRVPVDANKELRASTLRSDDVTAREGTPDELMKAVPKAEEGHVAALSVK